MQRTRLSIEPLLQATAPVPAAPLSTATPDFSLSLEPLPQNLQRGANVSVLAIVAGLGNFSGPVTLSTSGDVPQWLTITFTPATVTPVAPKPGWTATIGSTVYIDTSTVPNFYARQPAPDTRRSAHSNMAAIPLLLLLPLPFLRRSRKRIHPLLALGALAALPFANGCGAGIYPPQVAPGTYQINITGTATSGQQHTLPIMLRVIGG